MPEWMLAPVIDTAADWGQAAVVRGPFWNLRNLTPRQRRILLFMIEHHDRTGTSPSARQIAVAQGLSGPSVVAHHLNRLEQAGWVHRTPRRHAAMRVIAPVELTVHCDPLPVSA